MHKLYDTTEVFNLHGVPGLISGILSAILVSYYTDDVKYLYFPTVKSGRTNYAQGGYQMACLASSIGFAAVFGCIAGLALYRLARYNK